MSELIPAYNSNLPTDWKLETVGQISIRVGSGVTPRGGSEVYKNEGIIFIRSQNVTFTGLNLSDTAYIDEKTHRFMKSSEVFPFDVLLNITGASIGRCCFVPNKIGRANQNQHVCTIRLPEPNWADAKYLSSVLSSPIGQSQIARLNAGGNREGLNYEQLRSFKVVWPTSPERSKIAEILSTVDRAIEQTEVLIAKQQRIKTGLMQDLLTRGIDEHGNLRTEKTHKFRDSSLGRIPVEWEDQPVGFHLVSIEQGRSPDCESDPAPLGQWGVLKTTAVVWAGFQGCENKLLPLHLKPLSRLEVQAGDVLMTRGGPNSRVGVVTFVYETRPQLMLSDKLYRLVSKVSLDAEFLVMALASDRVQRHLSTLKTGLAESQTNISQEIVRRLRIPVPRKDEQAQIANIVRGVSRHLTADVRQLAKLRSLKTALMQDLLTGKRRVTPLLSDPSEAPE